MKRLFGPFLACFAAFPALAQQARAPEAIELPSDLVMQVRHYLGTRPYDEAAPMINSMAACVSVQVPQEGVIRDTGQCPAVSAARRERDAKVAALQAELAKAKAPKEDPPKP